MNIYWCHEKHEYAGLYVVALTRGRSKVLYSDEVECEMIDVRTHIARRGVNEHFEGVIDEGSPLLEKYDLEYAESEDW